MEEITVIQATTVEAECISIEIPITRVKEKQALFLPLTLALVVIIAVSWEERARVNKIITHIHRASILNRLLPLI